MRLLWRVLIFGSFGFPIGLLDIFRAHGPNLRQRFTFRATRCTVERHDSIGLAVPGFRRNTAPIPKRCTVSVFFQPFLMGSRCRKIFCNASWASV